MKPNQASLWYSYGVHPETERFDSFHVLKYFDAKQLIFSGLRANAKPSERGTFRNSCSHVLRVNSYRKVDLRRKIMIKAAVERIEQAGGRLCT